MHFENNQERELFILFGACANRLFRSDDPHEFLEWIEQAGPALATEMASMIQPEAGSPGQFFRLFGTQIYSTMPLPDHSYTLKAFPMPGRNGTCICGSGRKYKHCCLMIDAPPVTGYNMLRHVLDGHTLKDLAQLPTTKVDTIDIADTAMQWLQEDNVRRTAALLEPWFKANVTLTERQAPLFDLMMDVYSYQGNTVKRKKLLRRACESDSRLLRSEAYQRLATIQADNGDFDSAWQSMLAAQKATPNSLSVALLELTLLCFRGESEQAKARATFWLTRFRRDRDIDPDLIELLQDCTVDPVASLLETSQPETPPIGVAELIELFSSASVPEPCYTLDIFDDMAQLQPSVKLKKAERAWQKRVDAPKPTLTETQTGDGRLWETVDQWLPLLSKHPELWQSFDVLDDLVLAVDALMLEELNDTLLVPLLDRGVALLDCNLSNRLPGETSLAWIIVENRPALRLLAHRALLDYYRTPEDMQAFIILAEKLQKLNPNDNHGIRENLSTAYLFTDQPEKVLNLYDQYPDDALCTLPLNTILALYQMNKKGNALVKLTEIKEDYEVVIKMLLAKDPKKPKFSGQGIRLGSKEEAWLYREKALPVWKKNGALQWLEQSCQSLKIKRR